MDWKTYYDRFYDWEESTQLRHMSALINFGPSTEVTELAGCFVEEKSATRLIKKALAAGVQFTAEDILDLDGVVAESMMPQLIKSISHPLTAENLDELSHLLSKDEFKVLANKSGFRVDEYGCIITPEMEEAARQLKEEERQAQEEFERFQAEQKAIEEENRLIAKAILAVRSMNRRARRKKRREGR